MRLIDADKLIKDQVENDPVRIAVMCAPTAFNKERVIDSLSDLRDFASKLASAFDEVGDIINMTVQDSISHAYQRAIDLLDEGGIT